MILDEQRLRELVKDCVREVLAEAPPRTAAAGDFISVRDAARIAAVAQDTVRSWIGQKKLRAFRAGSRIRIRRGELEALLSAPAAQPKGTPEQLAGRYVHRHRRRRSG